MTWKLVVAPASRRRCRVTDLPDPGPPRVGVIGLGGIGAGASRGIIAHGQPLVVCDVRPEAIEALGPHVVAVDSPAQACEHADVLLIAVWDDAQVRSVISGERGVLHARTPPNVVVILSTTTLDTIQWAQSALGERQVALLDCGVAGGVKALEHGSIVAMVGGDAADVAYAMPVLDAFANPVIHLGPVGTGMAAKLARNMITYIERVVVWEAMLLASAADVDPARFLEVVRATDRWNTHTALLDRGYLPPTAKDGDPSFAAQTASYAHKDLAAAIELGRQVGVSLPVTEIADRQYDAAVGRPVEVSARR
jgi:3-hydroxyisobutyrate dehydrogenase-like beta-hydroxyacid dehydrogenase